MYRVLAMYLRLVAAVVRLGTPEALDVAVPALELLAVVVAERLADEEEE